MNPVNPNLDFILTTLRRVIKDIEERKTNYLSIECLNIVQHLVINMSNKLHIVPSLALAEIKWRHTQEKEIEKQKNIFNMCCRRMVSMIQKQVE
jgi:hypothetical protein